MKSRSSEPMRFAMSVLVLMTVRDPDADRFVAAHKKVSPLFAEMGAKDHRVFRSESDPNEVTLMADWKSHDDIDRLRDVGLWIVVARGRSSQLTGASDPGRLHVVLAGAH